jgi:hypothetical protein
MRISNSQVPSVKESTLSKTPKELLMSAAHQRLENALYEPPSKVAHAHSLEEDTLNASRDIHAPEEKCIIPNKEAQVHFAEESTILALKSSDKRRKEHAPLGECSLSSMECVQQRRSQHLEEVNICDKLVTCSVSQDLPHSSFRIVYAEPLYLKFDFKINWKFLLLLSATFLGLVSADDCAVMIEWQPARFNGSGIDCCFQSGIVCVSGRIKQMYAIPINPILEIYDLKDSQARYHRG